MWVTLKIFGVGLECVWPAIIVFGVYTLSSTEASWDIGYRKDCGEGDIKRVETGERERKRKSKRAGDADVRSFSLLPREPLQRREACIPTRDQVSARYKLVIDLGH